MAGKRSTPEQTVAKLRQVEVLTAQGKTVAEAVQAIGVTEPTYGTSCWTARLQLAREVNGPASMMPANARADALLQAEVGRLLRQAAQAHRQRCGRHDEVHHHVGDDGADHGGDEAGLARDGADRAVAGNPGRGARDAEQGTRAA